MTRLPDGVFGLPPGNLLRAALEAHYDADHPGELAACRDIECVAALAAWEKTVRVLP